MATRSVWCRGWSMASSCPGSTASNRSSPERSAPTLSEEPDPAMCSEMACQQARVLWALDTGESTGVDGDVSGLTGSVDGGLSESVDGASCTPARVPRTSSNTAIASAFT